MRVSPQTLMFAWIWFWHLENLNKNQQKGIQGTVMRIEASVKTHVSIRSQNGDFSNMNKELSMKHQDSRKNNEDQKMGCIWFKTIKTIKRIINIKHLISIDIWYPSSNQPTHSFFLLGVTVSPLPWPPDYCLQLPARDDTSGWELPIEKIYRDSLLIQSTTRGLKQQIQDVSGKYIVISRKFHRKFQQSGGFRPIKQNKNIHGCSTVSIQETSSYVATSPDP